MKENITTLIDLNKNNIDGRKDFYYDHCFWSHDK
jgi:hypothetical protein